MRQNYQTTTGKRHVRISVVDPYTLYLNPDPGFWFNLDPVRIDGYVISFGREKNVKIVSVGCMDDYFFLSLILHLLPLIYPFFTYVDPVLYRYLEYGSGSTTLVCTYVCA